MPLCYILDRGGQVQEKLKQAGIPTAAHYLIPMNQEPAYRHLCCHGETPNAAEAGQRVMSLPMSADLTAADLDRVVDALVSVFRTLNDC